MSQTENPDEPDPSRRRDYEVGRGRPPVATRFQPGNNRNPRGRPKQKKTTGQLIEEAMNAKVRIVVEGNAKFMTKQEVIIHNLVNAAARGEHKAIHTLLALRARYQDSTQTAINPLDLDASDRKIIEAFLVNASENGAVPESVPADDQSPAVGDETNNDAASKPDGNGT
jgi:Family of unknown function (DUF5681)